MIENGTVVRDLKTGHNAVVIGGDFTRSRPVYYLSLRCRPFEASQPPILRGRFARYATQVESLGFKHEPPFEATGAMARLEIVEGS